jgi:hypothetical protein
VGNNGPEPLVIAPPLEDERLRKISELAVAHIFDMCLRAPPTLPIPEGTSLQLGVCRMDDNSTTSNEPQRFSRAERIMMKITGGTLLILIVGVWAIAKYDNAQDRKRLTASAHQTVNSPVLPNPQPTAAPPPKGETSSSPSTADSSATVCTEFKALFLDVAAGTLKDRQILGEAMLIAEKARDAAPELLTVSRYLYLALESVDRSAISNGFDAFKAACRNEGYELGI